MMPIEVSRGSPDLPSLSPQMLLFHTIPLLLLSTLSSSQPVTRTQLREARAPIPSRKMGKLSAAGRAASASAAAAALRPRQDFISFLCAQPGTEPCLSGMENIPFGAEKPQTLLDWVRSEYQCYDPKTDRRSCGGCIGFGEGRVVPASLLDDLIFD